MSDLPSGWRPSDLGEVASFVMGQAPPGATCNADSVGEPFVKAGEFGSERPIIREWTTRPLKRALPTDVLVCVVGATCGKVNLGADCAIGRSVAAIRPTAALEQRFLYAFMRTQTLSLRRGSTGSAQGVISQEQLTKLDVPLPPLAEQRRIVAKLDGLMARTVRARAELARILALIAHHKRAILAAAFDGALTAEWRTGNPSTISAEVVKRIHARRDEYISGRRGSRLRDAPPLDLTATGSEGGWISGCLADISSLKVGFAFKSEWFETNGVPLVRGVNIAPGSIDWSDRKCISPSRARDFAEFQLKAGQIVVAMDRPLISSGLKIAVLEPRDDGALLVQRVAAIEPGYDIAPRFLWWMLNGTLFIDHIQKHATGSDLPHISGNDILTTPIVLPPMIEQQEIVRRIETTFAWLDKVAAEHAAATRLLDHLDQSLLAKAFRGELVPQDPADEPASELLARIRADRAAAAPPARKKRLARSSP